MELRTKEEEEEEEEEEEGEEGKGGDNTNFWDQFPTEWSNVTQQSLIVTS